MADPVGVTYGIRSANGKRKTVLFWFPNGTTQADLIETLPALAEALDNVVDGVIEDATITLPLVLPGGLKTEAIEGNTVREGMILSYDAAGTSRRYSLYIPSANNANFTGDTVDTDVVATDALVGLIADSIASEPDQTDEFGNNLVAFIGGERTFRK